MSISHRAGRSLRAAALLAATALAVSLLAAPVTQAAEGGNADSGTKQAQVIRDWNAIAVRTIVTENAAPPGVAQLYLGFVSSAVYDAITTARPGMDAQAAAVGTAAHDVLVEYFPASAGNLDADLTALLAAIPDGEGEDRGSAVGAAAADRLIASRVGDGRNAAITLDVPPAPGVWRPTPPGFLPMATPWVGFTKPLLLASPTSIDLGHPDLLDSKEYVADFAEVKSLGALDSTTRTPAGTENALFWNFSVPVLFNVSVRDWAARQDLGARATARWFALLNMTVTDSYITCWRAKYDQPFWRPITAIREADTDGNPATTVDPAWTPLIDTPPYPDWPSGHGCLTSAYLRGLWHLTGSHALDLTITNPVMGLSRHYTSATMLAEDAFISRIQLGIHFRDAMVDAYRAGRLASDRGVAIFKHRFDGNR